MKHIINFGCPRTGTTFIQKCFMELRGASAHKLSEGNPCHPCQSNNGLWHLIKMIFKGLLIVRTVRNPIDVIKSFYMLRMPQYEGAFPIKTDDHMMRFMVNEEINFKKQKADMEKWMNTPFITINYDTFHLKENKEIVINSILNIIGLGEHYTYNKTLLNNWFAKFKTESVSLGRFGEGRLDQEVIDPAHLKKLVNQYRQQTGTK